MDADLAYCVEEMKRYVNEGYSPTPRILEEPFTVEEIYASCFHKVELKEPSAKFLSVDASSYPLMRANNWRIGTSRCAYVVVERVDGCWSISREGYEDHVFPTFGSAQQRPFHIWAKLRELESLVAAKQISCLTAGDFCLMDGAAFFGGGRKYSSKLYQACRERGIRLLMVPKNSPVLHDKMRRDLLAAISIQGSNLQKAGILGDCWAYHPIRRARVSSKDLYGDVSCVKLSPTSSRVFRCDIMDYLLGEGGTNSMLDIVAGLAALSRDARCDGYPAPLFLAHERTRIPEAKLLEYQEQVQRCLAEHKLLDFLMKEAETSNFRMQLLGLTHDYRVMEEYEV